MGADNQKVFPFYSSKVSVMKYPIYHSVEDVSSVFKSLETGIRSGTIMAKV